MLLFFISERRPVVGMSLLEGLRGADVYGFLLIAAHDGRLVDHRAGLATAIEGTFCFDAAVACVAFWGVMFVLFLQCFGIV